MPKKKTSKSTSKKLGSRSVSQRLDDHSFLIILGGGFIIITIVMIFLSSQAALSRELINKMTTQVLVQKDETVSISNFDYSPKIITIKSGTKVTWSNADAVDHSVVADDGTFDTGVLAPGEKGSYTFTKVGTYTYHCGIHPSMTATVVVE